MGYLIALEDVTPPARNDDRPWATATIEESATIDGPWAELEVQAFEPPDADPADPISRSFSTDKGTLAAGWYRLFLQDGGGGKYTMNPVRLARRWAPTEADVGALIRARTMVKGGRELGTFTDDTRVTATEARRHIDMAVRRVAAAVGAEPCTDDLRDSARSVAAIRAAMTIEQSYNPEQTSNAGSSFTSLRDMWREDLKVLVEAVGEQCGGGDGESVGGEGQIPREGSDELPLIGRTGPLW